MAKKGTLKYRKVSRTPQVGKDAGKKKFYATAVQDRTMEFEDFVTSGARAAAWSAAAVVTARSITAVTFLGHFTAKGSNLTHLAKLGVAPVLGVAHDEVYASDAGSVHLLGVVLTTRGHADGEETQVGEAYALAIEDEFLEAVEGVHQNTMYGATRVRRVVL